MSQKITEKEVTQILLDNSYVLITQQEDDGSGQKVESLRRIPLHVFLQKCGGAGNENGQLDPEFVKQIVDNYLAANPPSVTETDPTVPAWAKAAEKPAYTAAEVGAISQEDLQDATDAALSQAKESGQFDGEPGKDGIDGKDGLPGKDGIDGVGIQSVIQTTTSTEDGGTNVITVTKTDGTSYTFSVKNGSRGSTGPAGADGAPGADGHTPVKGTDYWTAEDQQAIVSDVLAALPTWKGGSY